MSAINFLLSRFYPNFLQILSKFYADFIQIFSRFYPNFLQIFSKFYADFVQILSRFLKKSGKNLDKCFFYFIQILSRSVSRFFRNSLYPVKIWIKLGYNQGKITIKGHGWAYWQLFSHMKEIIWSKINFENSFFMHICFKNERWLARQHFQHKLQSLLENDFALQNSKLYNFIYFDMQS